MLNMHIRFQAYTSAILVCILVNSCTSKDGESDAEVMHKATDFQTIRNVECLVAEPDAIINIENFVVADSVLICQSSGNDNCFYKLSLKNFNAVDSFGVRGPGPGEFLYPRLAPVIGKNRCGIIDNGQCALYTSTRGNDTTQSKVQLPAIAVNSPAIIGDTAIIYMECLPDKLSLSSYNLLNGQIGTLIDFSDDKGEAIKHDFSWDTNGKEAVLAHFHTDRIAVGRFTSDLRLSGTQVYEGDMSLTARKECYVDVVAGPKYFYLLSNKNVEKDYSGGYSDIEIYDYDCNPVALLHLDIPAWLMTMDETNHRLLITSPLNDNINIISLCENEF